MLRKSFISFLFVVTVVALQSSGAFAQGAPVSGMVELQKSDGTKEPVVGALVEAYRTDIKAGFPSARTNKRGVFIFASMPLGATYVLSVSAPEASPSTLPNVKAGMENLKITLSPGNGSKFTEDEVRKGAAGK